MTPIFLFVAMIITGWVAAGAFGFAALRKVAFWAIESAEDSIDKDGVGQALTISGALIGVSCAVIGVTLFAFSPTFPQFLGIAGVSAATVLFYQSQIISPLAEKFAGRFCQKDESEVVQAPIAVSTATESVEA